MTAPTPATAARDAARYHMERHDDDDGAIRYEIWDCAPDSYGVLCVVPDDLADDAKAKAEQIVVAMNSRAAPETAAERDRLIAINGELLAALRNLARAEAFYRAQHDQCGDGHILTGRAWDLMRRAGDDARAAISRATAPVKP